jgi:hypothetical protein
MESKNAEENPNERSCNNIHIEKRISHDGVQLIFLSSGRCHCVVYEISTKDSQESFFMYSVIRNLNIYTAYSV